MKWQQNTHMERDYKMKAKIILLSILFYSQAHAVQVIDHGSKTVVKPFGTYKAPEVSNQATLLNIETNFSMENQQICGYTDWTSSVVTLPKQLLSGEFWANKMDQVKREAIKSVLAISGALPSMLACNASPTFCEVLNTARMLAQGQLDFTADTCRMLDGLANSSHLQSAALAKCIKKVIKEQSMSASQAREYCITNGNLEEDSQSDKNKSVFSKAGEIYNKLKFTDKYCKDSDTKYNRGSAATFSVAKKSCQYMKEIFPGFTFRATGVISTSGTYRSSPAEEIYEVERAKIHKNIVNILRQMHMVRYKFQYPREDVIDHVNVLKQYGYKCSEFKNYKKLTCRVKYLEGMCKSQEDGKCVGDESLIPGVWRMSRNGAAPTLLAPPEMLYDLVDALGPGVDVVRMANKNSNLAFIINNLTNSIAYNKATDIVNDAISRTTQVCSEIEMQDVASQADCKQKISVLAAEQKNLKVRREVDNDLINKHKEFYAEVHRLQRMKTFISRKPKPGRVQSPEIKDPKDM